ncbi:MAG: twin-arginine translocase subunit TatC [Chloroflexi bacterium]|nr:twin-arginine translocase subunit TatC [Chloroflexota bacterium]
MANEVQMTVIEHLEELRQRLLKCLIAVAVTTTLSFAFTTQIMRILIAPAGIKPVFLRPTEMFITYFRVALLSGSILAMPVIVYQVIQFIWPGLQSSERSYVRIIVPAATLSFILGVLFTYFVLLPFSLRYLVSFGGDLVEAKWAIGEYISFVTTLLFWSGVVFETPLIVYFLARWRIVSPQFLSRNRKFAVLLIAVIAAVITPTPDPFNMGLVMIPLLLMYEAGILLAKLAYRGRS